jgi:AbrB family looped-hinge helix DNA binding protein
MKTVTVSSRGQIAIPKEAREALQLQEGDRLIFEIKQGRIVLEPVIAVPRSQAWFWSKNVQEKVKRSEKNYTAGRFKRYNDVDVLIRDLKDE